MQMTSQKNGLDQSDLDLQSILGLQTRSAQLRQYLAEARKRIKNLGIFVESLKEVGDGIATKMKAVTKLETSVTIKREQCLAMSDLTRKREVEIEFLKKREKTLDCSLALLKKKLACGNSENV